MGAAWQEPGSGESVGVSGDSTEQGRRSHQSRMDLLSTGGTMERMVA